MELKKRLGKGGGRTCIGSMGAVFESNSGIAADGAIARARSEAVVSK